MLNKVQLIGRIGQAPEVRYMANGEAVCNFSLATTEKFKDKAGEQQEQTEWHRVSAWGRQAEVIGEYLNKGSLIYVEGKIQSRKYTDKSGVEKVSVEIRMSELKMLGHRQTEQNIAPSASTHAQQAQGGHRTSGPRTAPASAAPQAQKPRTAPPPQSGFSDMDDDIPFASSSMHYDMTTSKQRKMARYDY